MKNKIIHLFIAFTLIGSFCVYAAQQNNIVNDVRALRKDVREIKDMQKKHNYIVKYNFTEPYAHGSAVVTSPLIGIRESYDPSDLMINLPSMNEDLRLLEERQKISSHVKKHSIPFPRRPILVLTGFVEGGFIYNDEYNAEPTFDIDLTGAEVDFIGEINPWVTTALMFSYDNSQMNPFDRVNNSNIKLDRGFVTIGQLDKSPMYFTVGQIILPFGDYGNYRINSPSTQVLGKIKQRAAVIGCSYKGVYASVYGFKGRTHVDDSINFLKRGGVNLGYNYNNDNLRFDIGAGYTGNIAESIGMQSTGLTVFPGFETTPTLVKRVPGANAHAAIAINNKYDFLGEFVTATREFDPSDLTFNGEGAQPMALNLEAQYEFSAYNKPSAIAVGYGRTWEALALNVPKHDYFVSVHTSIWKDTIEALEYRRDVNYSSTTTASGHESDPFVPAGSKYRNTVTAKIGVYF